MARVLLGNIKGPKGDPGPQGPVGKGEPGYTPVKGVDYFTEEDKRSLAAYYAPTYTYGTNDLVAGSSALETGKLHFVYE